jgi:hypothetical protein
MIFLNRDLYYKSLLIIIYNHNNNTIIIYDHNDSFKYYKTMILADLALARSVNYDCKAHSRLGPMF